MIEKSKYIVGIREASEYAGFPYSTFKKHYRRFYIEAGIELPARYSSKIIQFKKSDLDRLYKTFQMGGKI